MALSNAVSLYIEKIKKNRKIKPNFNSFYDFVRKDYRKVLADKNVREKDFDVDGFLNVLEPYYKNGEYGYLLNSDKGTGFTEQAVHRIRTGCREG